MPGAMHELRAVARALDHRTRGMIDRLGRHARLDGRDARGPRRVHGLEHLHELGRRRSRPERARDVGSVAVGEGAQIQQHGLVRADLAIRSEVVGEGRVRPRGHDHPGLIVAQRLEALDRGLP